MQKVIILADGDYPTHPLPLAVLQSGLPVVCCDGAANRFVAEGGIPTAIIGDGDSLSDEVRERFAHLIHHVAEQETKAPAIFASLVRLESVSVTHWATSVCSCNTTARDSACACSPIIAKSSLVQVSFHYPHFQVSKCLSST